MPPPILTPVTLPPLVPSDLSPTYSPPLPVTPTTASSPAYASPSAASELPASSSSPASASSASAPLASDSPRSRNDIFSSSWSFAASPPPKPLPPSAITSRTQIASASASTPVSASPSTIGGSSVAGAGSWARSRASSDASSVHSTSDERERGASVHHGARLDKAALADNRRLSTSSSSSSSAGPDLSLESVRQHRKHSSSISSTSSRTSCFFDTPALSATPPPPPVPPTSLVPSAVTPGSLLRIIPPSPVVEPRPLRTTPLSPLVRRQSPSPPATPAPPPPPLPPRHSTYDRPTVLRLATTPASLLGEGLRAHVYLAAAAFRSSLAKGKGKWSLCAAKLARDEDGDEGRFALWREGAVLEWLGGPAEGLVGYRGRWNMETCEHEDLQEGKVRAIRRASLQSPTRSRFSTGSLPGSPILTCFDTHVLAPTPSSISETFSTSPTSPSALPTRPVLLLEYCPGGTLDAFVREHPARVTRARWTGWVGALASAGEWLESRGVLHCDIKPQNILLTADFEPRLTDFGSSLILSHPYSSSSSASSTGFLPLGPGVVPGTGTTPYSSPELLLRPDTASFPCDVFALGATLYVAANAGREPWQGVTGAREMCFWVGRGGFWEWEERARAARIGEPGGDVGGVGRGGVNIRRTGSLKEPGAYGISGRTGSVQDHLHHQQSLTTAMASPMAEFGAGGGGRPDLRRTGSWERCTSETAPAASAVGGSTTVQTQPSASGSSNKTDAWWRLGGGGSGGRSPTLPYRKAPPLVQLTSPTQMEHTRNQHWTLHRLALEDAEPDFVSEAERKRTAIRKALERGLLEPASDDEATDGGEYDDEKEDTASDSDVAMRDEDVQGEEEHAPDKTSSRQIEGPNSSSFIWASQPDALVPPKLNHRLSSSSTITSLSRPTTSTSSGSSTTSTSSTGVVSPGLRAGDTHLLGSSTTLSPMPSPSRSRSPSLLPSQTPPASATRHPLPLFMEDAYSVSHQQHHPVDDDPRPLGGVPWFFPSPAAEEVPEGARKLLRRMLDPVPERRGTMREVKEWAQREGWRSGLRAADHH